MTLFPNITSDARQDIKDIGKYLEERNLVAARRFVEAIEQTAEMLCDNPELGERLRTDPTGQIRYRTISGFRNYLISIAAWMTCLKLSVSFTEHGITGSCLSEMPATATDEGSHGPQASIEAYFPPWGISVLKPRW